MTTYIIAPTMRDVKHVRRQFEEIVERLGSVVDTKVVEIVASESDRLRGRTIGQGDLVVWEERHLARYASEQFWDEWSWCQRTDFSPHILSLGDRRSQP